MTLSPEQKATVSTWIAAGDNLSAVQKKLREQFQISMTYMDVRFLVDDLNLTLKDPAPKTDTSDVTKAKAAAPTPAAAKSATAASASSAPQATNDADQPAAEADPDALEDDALPPVPGNVRVQVDGMTLDPRMIASGSVTFSDGVHGKWFVDQQGRPGLSEVSQPGYRPSPEDAQAFMRELDEALRQKGF